MVSTDLGACEWFVWDLRRSNLLDRGLLDQVVGEFLEKNPRAEPPALADFLVKQNLLTEFQVERLLKGKTQGFVLGPFTLMDALGSGSMGTVYKAQSKNDSQWYAVKVLPRRSMWNVRIARRKVRSFEQCQHPAVVPFVDVGTSGGMHYLAWPLIEGETLDKVVAREGQLPLDRAVSYVRQIAEGLDVCHQQGLFHGLLKPSNLMVTPEQQIRILDFGIGSLLAETEGESLVDTMSTANSVASGLDCASPESIMDPTNLTPLGDQYSLGCVLYCLLSGRYPFPEGTAAEKMMAHQFKQPTPIKELVPDLPEGLIQIVERLMQKSPEARYGTSTEVVEALKPFAASGPGRRPAPATSAREAPPQRPLPQRVENQPPRPATPPPAPAPRPTAGNGRPTQPEPAPIERKQGPAPYPQPSTPASAPARPGAMQVPTRQSLRGAPVAEALVRRAEAPPPAPPPNPPAKMLARDKKPHVAATWDEPPLSWEERLGPLGIAISAIVVCALAWLLTWKLF
jgi:serine/threonine-protein kinase